MPTFTALVLIHGYLARTRTAIRDRFTGTGHETGASTLEMAVITLALLVVAGILVAAITAAVNSRVAQIN